MVCKIEKEDALVLLDLSRNVKVNVSDNKKIETILYTKDRSFSFLIYNGFVGYNLNVEFSKNKTEENSFKVEISCEERAIGVGTVSIKKNKGNVTVKAVNETREIEVFNWTKRVYLYLYYIMYLYIKKDKVKLISNEGIIGDNTDIYVTKNLYKFIQSFYAEYME